MIKKMENFMNSFTAETRRQLKREQKARVMENLGRCIGIQLMYLVPYVLLMVILYVERSRSSQAVSAQTITS